MASKADAPIASVMLKATDWFTAIPVPAVITLKLTEVDVKLETNHPAGAAGFDVKTVPVAPSEKLTRL